jgi:hypothetical protein
MASTLRAKVIRYVRTANLYSVYYRGMAVIPCQVSYTVIPLLTFTSAIWAIIKLLKPI